MPLPCSTDILISVRPEFFHRILGGDKTVELRRRSLRVTVGTRVWIYETVPVGKVAAMAEVAAIDEDSPSQIWKRYGDRAAISKREFFAYFDASELGCAIVLENVAPMDRPLKLSELRESLGNFVAPQFYRRLAIDGAELSLFRECASRCPSWERARRSRLPAGAPNIVQPLRAGMSDAPTALPSDKQNRR